MDRQILLKETYSRNTQQPSSWISDINRSLSNIIENEIPTMKMWPKECKVLTFDGLFKISALAQGKRRNLQKIAARQLYAKFPDQDVPGRQCGETVQFSKGVSCLPFSFYFSKLLQTVSLSRWYHYPYRRWKGNRILKS